MCMRSSSYSSPLHGRRHLGQICITAFEQCYSRQPTDLMLEWEDVKDSIKMSFDS